MDEMSMKELILIQSVFMCKSTQAIIELINIQPGPDIFFKSFMELDQANMVQIMAFDSPMIGALLGNKNAKFNSQFPLFYKMRQNLDGEIQILTPIKIAIKHNQIRALNLMVDYMVEHQNSFAFSFMFTDVFIDLM